MKYKAHLRLASLGFLLLTQSLLLAQSESDDLYFSARDRRKVQYDNTSAAQSPVYSRSSTNNASSYRGYSSQAQSANTSARYSNPDYSRYKRSANNDNEEVGRSNAPQMQAPAQEDANVEYYSNRRFQQDAEIQNWNNQVNTGNRFNPAFGGFGFYDPFFNPWGVGCFRPAFFAGVPVYSSPGLTVSLGVGFGGFGGFGWGNPWGWNAGFGYGNPWLWNGGFGWGNPWGFHRYGFYDPFWGGGLAWGGGFGWGPHWGWGGPGWGGYYHGFHNGYWAGQGAGRSIYYGPRTGVRGSNFATGTSGRGRAMPEGASSNPQRAAAMPDRGGNTQGRSYTRPEYSTESGGRSRGRGNNPAAYQSAGTPSDYGSAVPGRGSYATGSAGVSGNAGDFSGRGTPRNQTPSYYRYDAGSGYNNTDAYMGTRGNAAPSGRGGRGGGDFSTSPGRQNQSNWSAPRQNPAPSQWAAPRQNYQQNYQQSAPSRSYSSPSWGGGSSSPSRGSYGGGGGGGGGAPRRGGR